MKVLIGQNHLDTIGGSETYVYTVIEELKRRKIKTFLLCGSDRYGIMSKKIYQNFNIVPNTYDKDLDICFINHTTTVAKALKNKIDESKIYQICHGTTPSLEQPFGSPIEKYISISEEVQEHLKNKNYESLVIRNGINTNKFTPTKSNKELKNILSLSQSDRFNTFLKKICDKNGWNFKSHNKFTNPVFDIQDTISESDLVVSLGRGAYESMSCGKNVLVADWRPYQKPMMDGLITPDNIEEIITTNCSGRKYRKEVNEENITQEIRKYSTTLGEYNREYALKNLNIINQIDKMLELK
jgi:hypothetical protein